MRACLKYNVLQPDRHMSTERVVGQRPPAHRPPAGSPQAFRVRAGRFKPIKGKSLLVCTGSELSPWMQEFLSAFDITNPRENVFLLDAEHAGPCEVTSGARLPYPFAFFGLTGRYLRKLRAGLVIVDQGTVAPRRFLDSARQDGIVVAHVDSETASTAGRDEPHDLASLAGMEAARKMSPYLALEREPYVKVKKRIRFFLWKHIFYHFNRTSLRRLSSFADINRSLGRPDSILCLGNGPSSEDPQIADGEYDAVFRVNHRWLARGYFTQANAVFTGAVESVISVGTDSLYVFINPERAMRMVMRARQQVPRLSFTNAQELGFPLAELAPYQPTNGLIMLYFAVKLNPPTLTVAGIDLYRDPRGAYPDETTTPNHYTSAHDEDREVAMLLELLASYRGELRIVGDKLASEYERYICEHRNTQ